MLKHDHLGSTLSRKPVRHARCSRCLRWKVDLDGLPCKNPLMKRHVDSLASEPPCMGRGYEEAIGRGHRKDGDSAEHHDWRPRIKSREQGPSKAGNRKWAESRYITLLAGQGRAIEQVDASGLVLERTRNQPYLSFFQKTKGQDSSHLRDHDCMTETHGNCLGCRRASSRCCTSGSPYNWGWNASNGSREELDQCCFSATETRHRVQPLGRVLAWGPEPTSMNNLFLVPRKFMANKWT